MRLTFVLAAVVFVGLRLAAFLPSSTRAFPDSGTYLHVAAQPLLSWDFVAGWRAFTPPLLYKLLPDSDAARSAGQLAISIVCWLALAAVVAWCVRRRGLRPVAFSLVLLFSLSVWITQWDRLILSESLAVSLTAAVLAAWLALVRAPSGWTIAAVLGTTLPWAFARDTDAYLALLAVPFVLGWAWRPGRRRGRILLAVGLVAIFATNALSTTRPNGGSLRWEIPLFDVITTRVLTSKSELRYFREHGMPVSPPVRALATKTPDGNAVLHSSERSKDPRLRSLRRWVHAHGRETLATFLITHPYRALAPVVRARETLLATDPPRPHAPTVTPLAEYRAAGTNPLLPARLDAVVYPHAVETVLVWLVLVIGAGACSVRRGAVTRMWLVPAVALLLQFPHAALVWNADSGDIARHGLIVGVMTRLSLLVLSIFLIDAALNVRRGGQLDYRGPPTTGGQS
jgi:hypothetical protein